MKVAEVDVLALDNYVDAFPHEMFRHLRREAPVYWHREDNGCGLWAVTR